MELKVLGDVFSFDEIMVNKYPKRISVAYSKTLRRSYAWIYVSIAKQYKEKILFIRILIVLSEIWHRLMFLIQYRFKSQMIFWRSVKIIILLPKSLKYKSLWEFTLTGFLSMDKKYSSRRLCHGLSFKKLS